MFSKLKWLILVQLLLNEQALCRVPPPLAPRRTSLPAGEEVLTQRDHPGLVSHAQKETRIQSADRVISRLRATLQDQIRGRLHIRGEVTCGQLMSASAVDDQLSSAFPRELLGLSLVPVLAAAGCRQEAQTLVLKLYDLLGVSDTEELLVEVQGLMMRRMTRSRSTPLSGKDHIEAVMFNIQQLAEVGEGPTGPGKRREKPCEGWTSVNGTRLVGTAVDGSRGGFQEAVNACERLGGLCAGVTGGGSLKPGRYEAVLRKGSRVLPSESPDSECWIRHCGAEEDQEDQEVWIRRTRRGVQTSSCTNRDEERVYNVMEWIPAVSTLYNLGTAVYYASVNCSETAKERAILSAVDLSTDALMVATGGTAGVAGYALGAGVKTGVKAGVKYLINSMKEDGDVLVNQISWEDGVMTVD